MKGKLKMRLVDKRRVTISMSEEELKRFNILVAYFDDQPMEKEMAYSVIINLVVKTFIQLFIEESNTNSFVKRLEQLRKIQSKDVVSLMNNDKYLMRQNDILLYAILAFGQKMGTNPNWKPEKLESIYSKDSSEQNQLIEQIFSLIQKDIERGKTIKSSHKS